ncbi:MAG: hypothetical protein Salg2KO_00250 [Salibacteraceae bacterium]
MKTAITFLISVFTITFAFAQHQHSSIHPPVTLNNGAKWSANVETTRGIESMVKHVQSYQTGEKADKGALHESLMDDYNGIFKNCTMKGEAHEQLHHYLLPLRDMLAELAACEDCSHVMEHIDKHLASYSAYFE